MRIIVVGGTGLIGQAVVKKLQPAHEVITAARHHADVELDISSIDSIENLYRSIKNFDALIIASGKVHYEEFDELDEKKFIFGLHNKLMGQVNLVNLGKNYIRDQGSFTLISGIIGFETIKCGVSAAMVNGALNNFVKAAAIELKRGIRINAVSPTIVAEAEKIHELFFKGFEAVPVDKVANAYVRSVEGIQTGRIYQVGY